MQLHDLKPLHKKSAKKRIGRGGKRGTYSGRGVKGQKARAGHRIRPAERDLIQRIPKLRGFKFKPIRPETVVLNLDDLESRIKGNIINKESLIGAGLIKKSEREVKILAGGDLTKKLEIIGIEVSKSARKKIEARGGTIRS